MSVDWEMHYDRRVSDGFLANFLAGGPARVLVEYARHAPFPIDLQFRHDARTGKEHASLYVGLTDVLNVRARKNGDLELSANKFWTDNQDYEFNMAWASGIGPNSWSGVETYLERVIPAATQSHASKEGGVQSAVSVFTSPERVMLDREAVFHFKSQAVKDDVMAEVTAPLLRAIGSAKGLVPGKPPVKFGGKCDVLAIDDAGNLLAVEVKPKGVASIRWSPAQATVYARLFQRWLDATDLPSTAQPLDVLRGMAHQRTTLGLTESVSDRLRHPPAVIPVVAIQRGAAKSHLDGLQRVQEHLLGAGVGDPNLRVYEVNMAGRLTPIG